MPTLQGVDLSKSYSGRKVVDNIELEIAQGEVVGLLGPNGAGKTTTFYMIVGLARPDSGRVLLNNSEITSGLCSNSTLPPNPSGAHAVLWEKDGSATDLGNLGGTLNVAASVNNLGEVVGAAQSSIDGNIHA